MGDNEDEDDIDGEEKSNDANQDEDRRKRENNAKNSGISFCLNFPRAAPRLCWHQNGEENYKLHKQHSHAEKPVQ